MRIYPADEVSLFLDKINRAGPDDCWEWIGGKDSRGYGMFSSKLEGKRKAIRAHRYVYRLCFGDVPAGLVVRHLCHNRACCNPKHLKTGTQADNIQDMMDANRQARGENSGPSKLTRDQVATIRTLLRGGTHTRQKIAAMFGVCGATITKIKQNQMWRQENS